MLRPLWSRGLMNNTPCYTLRYYLTDVQSDPSTSIGGNFRVTDSGQGYHYDFGRSVHHRHGVGFIPFSPAIKRCNLGRRTSIKAICGVDRQNRYTPIRLKDRQSDTIAGVSCNRHRSKHWTYPLDSRHGDCLEQRAKAHLRPDKAS